MLCSICKEKEATVFFTYIEHEVEKVFAKFCVKGRSKDKKADVCEECYNTNYDSLTKVSSEPIYE